MSEGYVVAIVTVIANAAANVALAWLRYHYRAHYGVEVDWKRNEEGNAK